MNQSERAKRDRFLTEDVLGECWHDEVVKDGSGRCGKCGLGLAVPHGTCIPTVKNNNFSTSDGFFKLWNAIKDQEWFHQFKAHAFEFHAGRDIHGDNWQVHPGLIDPDALADSLQSFYLKTLVNTIGKPSGSEASAALKAAREDDLLNGPEAVKRRLRQSDINCKFLLEAVDAIHEHLCPGQFGTWQDRVRQAVSEAQKIHDARKQGVEPGSGR